MSLLVWQIDDQPRWHEVTRATLARLPVDSCHSHHLHSAVEARLAWQAAIAADALPSLVLMDFYIGEARGDELTAELLRRAPASWHGQIIGHSSVAHCSALIVAAGGSTAVTKAVDSRGINKALLQWLGRHPAFRRQTRTGT